MVNELIKLFQKVAIELNRDANSITELKLWFQAEKELFNKIYQENQEFKDDHVYEIIKKLRDKYGLDDSEVYFFLKNYILLKDYKKETATFELDRTEGRPGQSYEEVRDTLEGMGVY